MSSALVVNPSDNVANALDDIAKGDVVSYAIDGAKMSVRAVDDVKFGFKISVKPINKGGDIIKYGCVIGVSSRDIQPGECVHIHNVEGNRGRGDKKEA